MMDEELPFDLRSTFTQLMLHLFVVASRDSPLLPLNYARPWMKTGTDVSVDRQTLLFHLPYFFIVAAFRYCWTSARV